MNLHRHITTSLRSLYDEGEARAITTMLLEHCGISLVQALTDDLPLTPHMQTLLDRLLQGEPIQYVIGYTLFAGLRINVREGVLIPRPETEQLVKFIIGGRQTLILDIGTGSGCIALALKHALPEAEVVGIDVSEEALSLARENARSLHLDVTFVQLDILTDDFSSATSLQTIISQASHVIIVSNPPYICQEEQTQMQDNVLRYEPHTALFVPDDDPLLFYRRIAQTALHLNKNVTLWFEINQRFGDEMQTLLTTLHYTDCRLLQDQFGNDRFIKATK